MAEEEKANVCTFTFKKRRGNAMRRKVDERENKSSSEEETVITRAEKKSQVGVISAKTVSDCVISTIFTNRVLVFCFVFSVQDHQKDPDS